MTYYTRGKAGLVRHRVDAYGRQTHAAVATKSLACDKCGWTAQALDDGRAALLPACICGGTLRVTTAIKKAMEGPPA